MSYSVSQAPFFVLRLVAKPRLRAAEGFWNSFFAVGSDTASPHRAA